jgi:CRISPR-associated protein Csm5
MKECAFDRYRLVLQPITPLHVGSGELIEPYEYVLESRGDDTYFLIAIDLPALFADMDHRQREEYDHVIEKGDFPGLRNWLRRTADPARHRRFEIEVMPDAYDELAEHLDNPERLGEIHLFTRDAAHGRPYVPGSSIKGAIRTAVTDAAAANANDAAQNELLTIAEHAGEKGQRHRVQHTQRFEAIALGHAREDRQGRTQADLYRDPFRQLAIPDIPLDRTGCYIDRVQIVHRPSQKQHQDTRYARSNPEGIVIYRDITWSCADGEQPQHIGEARMWPHLADPHVMGKNKKTGPNWVPQKLSIEQLCSACNRFYGPRMQDELETFNAAREASAALRSGFENLQPNECLIRLGRHTHFECVTVGDPYHRPPPRGFGKSRTYADYGKLPLGWAKLRFEQPSEPI